MALAIFLAHLFTNSTSSSSSACIKRTSLRTSGKIMLTVMAKAKNKQKKGKQANLSKTRKKGSMKKKATAKVRKGGKKKATRGKATLRSPATRVEAVPGPAAFTEIASEEVTSSTPALGEWEKIGSTESSGTIESGLTPTDSDSNTESV
jgi:hypothetical protein